MNYLGKIFSIKDAIYKPYMIMTILGFRIKIPFSKIRQEQFMIRKYLKQLTYWNMATVIHKKTFGAYKDINRGKVVVLVATGPTVNYYHFKTKEDIYYIGVNHAFYRNDIKLDALFMHDSAMLKGNNKEKLKNYEADKFVAYHIAGNNQIRFNMSLEDRAYIGAKTFLLSDLEVEADSGGLSHFFNPDVSSGLVLDMGTTFSALQFAMFTNPSKIYLVGCDCSTEGHFYSKQHQNGMIDKDCLDLEDGKNTLVGEQPQAWRDIAFSYKGYFPDMEIISVNPVGLKGLFRDVYTKEYLADHPEIKNPEIIDFDSI